MGLEHILLRLSRGQATRVTLTLRCRWPGCPVDTVTITVAYDPRRASVWAPWHCQQCGQELAFARGET